MMSDAGEETPGILACERCGIKNEVDPSDNLIACSGAWICDYCRAEEESCGCSDR